ncbi:hypothetical protein MBANPS3_012618, partial [Mucor bainieri]
MGKSKLQLCGCSQCKAFSVYGCYIGKTAWLAHKAAETLLQNRIRDEENGMDVLEERNTPIDDEDEDAEPDIIIAEDSGEVRLNEFDQDDDYDGYFDYGDDYDDVYDQQDTSMEDVDMDIEESQLNDGIGEDGHEDPADTDDNADEQFYDNSYLPQDAISFLLFLLVIMCYQEHTTDKGIELMLFFYNQVLLLCGSSYRFPKKVTTFKKWAQLSERLFSGVKPY